MWKNSQRMIENSDHILISYNQQFVHLSGDNNPIHTNPLLSRRLLFGKPVIHGIYSVLALLDLFYSSHLKLSRISYLKVKFLQPLYDGDYCEVKVLKRNDGYEFKVYVDSENKLSLFVKFEESPRTYKQDFLNEFPKLDTPVEIDTDEIEGRNFKLDLFLKIRTFNQIFPNLTLELNYNIFSILLASTRLVGVQCPGANSLFSELTISESDSKIPYMDVIVSKHYRSINLIKMEFRSLNFKGHISSFVRKTPQGQTLYSDILSLIDSRVFINENVLVVGGSRGLGEITAKILAAGGASVTITYASGIVEATSVVNEISKHGGNCKMLHLDINNLNAIDKNLLNEFNSCFYFPTPFIRTNNKEDVDLNLFNSFNGYYVKGFKNLLKCFNGLILKRVFYPSTIFIEEKPLNLREYTMSKFYGELVCKNLNQSQSAFKIYYPRLPKMSTDQTAVIFGDNGNDPLPILLKEIKFFYTHKE